MGMGKFITGVCEKAGTVPVGLLCNGFAGMLMKLGETGSIAKALQAVGIGNEASVASLLIIAGLGGLGLANACKSRAAGKSLADKVEAIAKTVQSDHQMIKSISEAVSASGVHLAASDQLDLIAAFEASQTKDLTAIPESILRKLNELGARIQIDNADLFAEIEASTRQITSQIDAVESRLTLLLASIAIDAKVSREILEGNAIPKATAALIAPHILRIADRPWTIPAA